MSTIRVSAITGDTPLQISNPSLQLTSTSSNALQVGGGATISKMLSIGQDLSIQNHTLSTDGSTPNGLTLTNQTTNQTLKMSPTSISLANEVTINDTGSITTKTVPITFKIATQPIVSINTDGSITSGPLYTSAIAPADPNSTLSIGNLTVYGPNHSTSPNQTTISGPLLMDGIDLSPTPGDINSQRTAYLDVGNGGEQVIPDFSFSSAFKAFVLVTINGLSANYQLLGNKSSNGWRLTTDATGEPLDLSFTVVDSFGLLPTGIILIKFGPSLASTDRVFLSYRGWALAPDTLPKYKDAVTGLLGGVWFFQNKGLTDAGFSNNILRIRGFYDHTVVVDDVPRFTRTDSNGNPMEYPDADYYTLWTIRSLEDGTYYYNLQNHDYGEKNWPLDLALAFVDGLPVTVPEYPMSSNASVYFISGPDNVVYIIDALTNRYLTAPSGTSTDRTPFLSDTISANAAWMWVNPNS